MFQKVYFLDIDDCLITTSALGKEHLEVVEKSLKSLMIPKAFEITKEFAASFGRVYDRHQGKKLSLTDKKLLEAYMKRLGKLEKPIIEEYRETKRWSREVCLFMAAEKFYVGLTNEQILTVTNALWEKITQKAVFYPDSKPFLNRLIEKKIPFYLITSSDSRLTYGYKYNDYFHYNPEYSRNLKLKRLKILTDFDIPEENIFIGDPHDKPNPWVFKQAMKKARKDLKKKFTSIMVGDSYKSDLVPAKKAGINKLILLDRYSKNNKIIRRDGVIAVKSLKYATA